MKRELGIEYLELADYVNENKKSQSLLKILKDVLAEASCIYEPGDDIWEALTKIYVSIPLIKNVDVEDLVKTVVDIYNDNYKLEEPRYRYHLKGARDKESYRLYLNVGFYFRDVDGNYLGYLDTKPVEMTEKQFLKYLPDEMSPDQFEREEVTE